MLASAAEAFAAKLAAVKRRVRPEPFDWYPYQSLSNVSTLDRLLDGQWGEVVAAIGNRPILDVGCADGDLAFFFESLGHAVHVIDNPITNFNAMRGVELLRRELQSRVSIHALDLDEQFTLPEEEYGLVLLLGLLYHLKNPYFVLETLSRRARYCLVSTTLTEFVPGVYESTGHSALAYLADVYEINHDSTNYWVLTDAAFRRLLRRANWEPRAYLVTSDRMGPSRMAEYRAFCLARSKFVDEPLNVLYGKGWHPPEEGGWRWTAREFAVRLESARYSGASAIELSLYIPEILIERFGAVTLSAIANGSDLATERFTAPGAFTYRRRLPQSTAEGDVRVDFFLDRALPADSSDRRERGLIVASIRGA